MEIEGLIPASSAAHF